MVKKNKRIPKKEKMSTREHEDLGALIKDSQDEKSWFSTSEATKYLGISRQTLYNLMDDGILPFYVLKGVRKRRLKKQDLDALLQRGESGKKKTAH